MDFIKRNDEILLIWDDSFDLESSQLSAESIKKDFEASIITEKIHHVSLGSYKDASFTLIILKLQESSNLEFFASLLKLLKPSGRILASPESSDQILENLKLAGFVNITFTENDIIAEKPKYEIGSAVKLSFAGAKDSVASVWKLADDDEDVINEDDLLDEKDKIKPDPADLKVCGTTGKRKACKDCSCGLAEELASENQAKDGPVEPSKSSCGSCYLGDAFRCASCPYLGMPAFKPGEKVQLAGGLLKDDL